MVPTLVIDPWMAALAGTVAITWLVGTSVLLVRLALAHLNLLRLRGAALPATAEQQQLCWTLAEKMGVWPPAMLVSPFVASPCLAGVVRPAILLPEELPDVPLSTVFVHELAHLRRHDCFWNVMRQAVSALLFFQPLVWRLSRRLETTAEEVCDDYVVEHGADRLTYADILVSMAERSWLPTSPAVVPLVTFRSSLGRRVARILDRTRRLSLSVSLTALALIVAGGLAATVGTGALGPAGRAPTAEKATTDEPDKTADSDAESAAPSAEEADKHVADEADDKAAGAVAADADAVPDGKLLLHYRGQVLDPEGRPLAGAKVILSYYNTRVHANSAAQRATTGADGWFDFETRRADFAQGIGKKWLAPGLVVAAEGYGCARRPSLDFETTGEARKHLSNEEIIEIGETATEHDNTLRLVRDDAPLTGRLVSTEGKPLAGVRVAVDAIWYNAEGDLAPWEKAATEPRGSLLAEQNDAAGDGL